MISLPKYDNKTSGLIVSFVLILIVGTFDYFSAAELTMTIFYLIPIAFHAFLKKSTRTTVIINTMVASLIWSIVIISDNLYSSIFYIIWNALIVQAFFLVTGLLAFSLKEKQKKNHEMTEHLRKMNEEKNRFIGIAGHDLRSPIGVIHSFSDLLLTDFSDELNPEISRIIKHIHEISDHTLLLLSNMLDISLIESGKINIVPIEQDFLFFIKQNMYLNQNFADKKSISITLDASDKEIRLKFDEHYLAEVMNNLLSNAIKFSAPNSNIIIRLTRTSPNGVLTEVIDNGQGIPEDEQSALFNYFQTTSTRSTAGEKSTGLGLAISKKIVTEHGGHIGVKSTFGKGSNFYFELF